MADEEDPCGGGKKNPRKRCQPDVDPEEDSEPDLDGPQPPFRGRSSTVTDAVRQTAMEFRKRARSDEFRPAQQPEQSVVAVKPPTTSAPVTPFPANLPVSEQLEDLSLLPGVRRVRPLPRSRYPVANDPFDKFSAYSGPGSSQQAVPRTISKISEESGSGSGSGSGNDSSGSSGPTRMSGQGKYLRKFYFSGGFRINFLFPKKKKISVPSTSGPPPPRPPPAGHQNPFLGNQPSTSNTSEPSTSTQGVSPSRTSKISKKKAHQAGLHSKGSSEDSTDSGESKPSSKQPPKKSPKSNKNGKENGKMIFLSLIFFRSKRSWTFA